MQFAELVDNVQKLSDVELAVLLSLVAGQHCIIETSEDTVEPLVEELQLTSLNTFGLPPTVVRCSESTTPDQLGNDVLMGAGGDRQASTSLGIATQVNQDLLPVQTTNIAGDEKHIRSTGSERLEDDHQFANIIILKDLGLAQYPVQIQVLELIRTRRTYSHTGMHAAPKLFGIIFVQNESNPSLNKHLIDHIFISHYHELEDGFPNLEETSDWIKDDRSSIHSVLHHTATKPSPISTSITFPLEKNIHKVISLSEEVTVSAEIKVYVQNIITFLRLHRAVGGGVSPRATQHFDLLIRCLASLHGSEFVTPALVALAARKIYPHRLSIVSAAKERSMQYGSSLASVANMLRNFTPDSVIEEVLACVEAPL